MRADSETYKNVAENCSSFAAKSDKDSYSNIEDQGDRVSCKNCKHFDKSEYCKLDLFDPIVENHQW